MKKILFAFIASAFLLTFFAGCDMNSDNDMASDINSTVSEIVSDTNSMLMPEDNVSSESH